MTGKLKKNIFRTGWIRLIHAAKSPSDLSRKAIEFNVKELCHKKEENRRIAARFFLTNDYIAICNLAGVDHCELKRSVSAMLNESGARKKKMAQHIVKWVRERPQKEQSI